MNKIGSNAFSWRVKQASKTEEENMRAFNKNLSGHDCWQWRWNDILWGKTHFQATMEGADSSERTRGIGSWPRRDCLRRDSTPIKIQTSVLKNIFTQASSRKHRCGLCDLICPCDSLIQGSLTPRLWTVKIQASWWEVSERLMSEASLYHSHSPWLTWLSKFHLLSDQWWH